ncbi:hypothetical protein SAMN04487846_3566 [Microbacterium sp. cf046]|nr:hypothetical protein SAMN04487846_3566 [Microbacterium sp. cf046]
MALVIALIGIIVSLPLQIPLLIRYRKAKDERWKIWAYACVFDVIAIAVLVGNIILTWEYRP